MSAICNPVFAGDIVCSCCVVFFSLLFVAANFYLSTIREIANCHQSEGKWKRCVHVSVCAGACVCVYTHSYSSYWGKQTCFIHYYCLKVCFLKQYWSWYFATFVLSFNRKEYWVWKCIFVFMKTYCKYHCEYFCIILIMFVLHAWLSNLSTYPSKHYHQQSL